MPRLYESLRRQTSNEFEWIVVDDGSTDSTGSLLRQWSSDDNNFDIRIVSTINRGKQRAVNDAVAMARYGWFFIVDSDDFLTDDAVETVLGWIADVTDESYVAGVSGLRYNLSLSPQDQPKPKFDGYVECTNLERQRYGITQDLAEVYRTDILRKYPFKVWPGETFTPECVVWDQIAIDGYRLRYYNRYIYNYEYLADGLTQGGYKTYAKNLMGCAMANEIKAVTAGTLAGKLSLINEMNIGCALSGNRRYLSQCRFPLLAKAIYPVSLAFAWRRAAILRKKGLR